MIRAFQAEGRASAKVLRQRVPGIFKERKREASGMAGTEREKGQWGKLKPEGTKAQMCRDSAGIRRGTAFTASEESQ